jgi:hypothetical protein
MKAWGWVALIPILGTLASAESLGDAAKRERERREKTKQAGTPTKVIQEEDLVTGPGKDAKGTFNPRPGAAARGGDAGASASPRGSTSPPPSTSSSAGEDRAPLTEVDAKRDAARRRLESSYGDIAGMAWSFIRAVRAYETCVNMQLSMTEYCRALANRIETSARAIAASMEEAEDAARQGWLAPGEVRDMRRRYRMDDSFWDELVTLVRRSRP